MNEDKYLTREEFQLWCNQWYEKYDKDCEEDRKKWEEHRAEIKQLREDFEKKWLENQKNIERILRRLDKHDEFLGIGVEGIAAMLLQPYIEDKYKIKLKNVLRRTLLNLNGKTVEVNLFGEGKKEKGKKSM